MSNKHIANINMGATNISDTTGPVISTAAGKVATVKTSVEFTFMRGLSIIILPNNINMNFMRIGVNVRKEVPKNTRIRRLSGTTVQPII